ncbi:uncharacterized protein [Parasteatoda tepidariorum]|nr:uncharacterized protein LOC122268836 isoform X2 [Parasteatoda tepidariorum]
MMAEDVKKRFEECQEMLHAPVECEEGKPLFPNPEQSEIFDCIAEKFPTVEGEDREKMRNFEKCARTLHAETCKIPKYL